MQKLTITCDCCLKEIEENEVFKLEHYIHVSPSFNRLNGHMRMVEGKSYSVSGRMERKDFCLPCYNLLMDKFFGAIKEARG